MSGYSENKTPGRMLEDYMKLKTAAFIYRYAHDHGTIPFSLTFEQWLRENHIRLYESVIRL